MHAYAEHTHTHTHILTQTNTQTNTHTHTHTHTHTQVDLPVFNGNHADLLYIVINKLMTDGFVFLNFFFLKKNICKKIFCIYIRLSSTRS